MRYQYQIILNTQRAVDDLFRTARAMPADKLEWKPLDNGRSALEQIQECAQFPGGIAKMIELRAMPPFTPEEFQRMREERKRWTFDECERICRENSEKLFAAIRNFPESDLGTLVHLPFGGGMDRSIADIMLFHYWNLVYHLGQINYIQTLYGDRDMH